MRRFSSPRCCCWAASGWHGRSVWFLLPEWRVNHEFVETTCRVLDRRIVEKRVEDGLLYGPELELEYSAGPGGPITAPSHYDIHGAYANSRGAAQAILDRFQTRSQAVGQPYPCWYDPANPSVVVLSRGYRWWVWLLLTVPVSFVSDRGGRIGIRCAATGEVGRATCRARPPRRPAAALDGRWSACRRVSLCPPGRRHHQQSGNASPVSPAGVHHSPGWALFGMLLFCVVWNGTVAVMGVWAVRGWRAGNPDWHLVLFLTLCLAAGIAAVGVFLRRFMAANAVGPTRIEISDHPVEPGGRYRVFLSHSGWRA